jgi:hypothetical protein
MPVAMRVFGDDRLGAAAAWSGHRMSMVRELDGVDWVEAISPVLLGGRESSGPRIVAHAASPGEQDEYEIDREARTFPLGGARRVARSG